jgi:hypothetical protein
MIIDGATAGRAMPLICFLMRRRERLGRRMERQGGITGRRIRGKRGRNTESIFVISAYPGIRISLDVAEMVTVVVVMVVVLTRS